MKTLLISFLLFQMSVAQIQLIEQPVVEGFSLPSVIEISHLDTIITVDGDTVHLPNTVYINSCNNITIPNEGNIDVNTNNTQNTISQSFIEMRGTNNVHSYQTTHCLDSLELDTLQMMIDSNLLPQLPSFTVNYDTLNVIVKDSLTGRQWLLKIEVAYGNHIYGCIDYCPPTTTPNDSTVICWYYGPNTSTYLLEVLELNTSSIEEQILSTFAYPNPAQNNIKIHVGNALSGSEFKLSVYDLSGKLVLQKQSQEPNIHLECSQLNNGFYTYQVNNKHQKSAIQKFIISK